MLSLTGHASSFMYYVSDNVLWAVGLMVRNGVLTQPTEHRWKDRKNTFSQANVVVNILRLSVLLVMRDMYNISPQYPRKERKLMFELSQQRDAQIVKGNATYKTVLSLIKLRRKRRFECIDLIVSTLRFFMLTKSLKTTGYQYLHPIFVATCGLVSAFISLFKSVYEKKIFIQLDQAKIPSSTADTTMKYKGSGVLKVGSTANFQE
jgi:hypothetical protein